MLSEPQDLDEDLAALAHEVDGDKAQLGLKEEDSACAHLGGHGV